MYDFKKFEEDVYFLLVLGGYEVKKEELLGHKKIDLYFERIWLGSKRRIAVECKFYEKVLTKDELVKIYADYLPLFKANLIDEILVVTWNGLSAGAETMINEVRELLHRTFSELQNQVMDFEPYLRDLINQYEEDGLSQYYVDLQTADGNILEREVEGWINARNATPPLAILASYGMGKTTFAKRLSYELAKKAKLDHKGRSRIPIFLKLGEISTEQSLEGLLGKALTATSIVRNYAFNAFMSFNAAGRFVILLDGFDEMKHTLTWDEFKFNFREINRFVKGRSKIILLGRPTAFLSEDEQRFALHGITASAGQTLYDPEWPDYAEIYLAPFSRTQVQEFLNGYLRYKQRSAKTATDWVKFQNIIDTQIKKVSGKHLSDIARRPVQLKMLAEVLPQWEGDINDLTIPVLYSVFIDNIIEREMGKKSRQKFGVRERRQFAQELAWWMWMNKKEMSITAKDIPPFLFQRFSRNMDKLDGVRRDLVSACFLEKKDGGSLYFPHRSFQEFLVAEEMVDKLGENSLTFKEANALMTEEISTFISGLVSRNILFQWNRNLQNHSGSLKWMFAKIWLSDETYKEFIIDLAKDTEIPWYPLFLIMAINNSLYKGFKVKEFSEILVEKINTTNAPLYALFCFFCLTSVSTRLRTESRTSNATFINALTGLYRFSRNAHVNQFISKIIINKKKGILDLSGTYTTLCEFLKDFCIISDWIEGKTIKSSDISFLGKLPISESQIHHLDIAKYSGRT